MAHLPRTPASSLPYPQALEFPVPVYPEPCRSYEPLLIMADEWEDSWKTIRKED